MDFSEAIKEVTRLLGLDSLKPKQKEALQSSISFHFFFSGKEHKWSFKTLLHIYNTVVTISGQST